MKGTMKFISAILIIACLFSLTSCFVTIEKDNSVAEGGGAGVDVGASGNAGAGVGSSDEDGSAVGGASSTCKHSFGEWNVSTAASCKQTGVRTRTCSKCNFSDDEIIEKAAHKFGTPTVISEGDCENERKREHTCEVCGYKMMEITSAPGHDYTGSDAVCSKCGDLKNGTPGLLFELQTTGDLAGTYKVASIGTAIKAKNIVIPAEYKGKPVTAIGEDAFSGFEIESVIIGVNVKRIEFTAFYGCAELKTVTFKKGSQLESFTGFSECTSLVSVTIPENVMNVDCAALRGCTALTSVTFEKTEGWYKGYQGSSKSEATSVTNAAKNANMLKDYSNNYFYFRLPEFN